ncbi:hypothetical protein [Conyzicola sp.]|uniref:hypothetical protein n=1 Tax=Conyzicola sp. TaxID=1969404 RepID=UPI00398A220D
MTIPQEQFDDLLSRTALAAMFYYPEIAVDDEDYRIQNDVDYCMEPIFGLAEEVDEQLRLAVGRTIADPTAHRAGLIALVIELAPPPIE